MCGSSVPRAGPAISEDPGGGVGGVGWGVWQGRAQLPSRPSCCALVFVSLVPCVLPCAQGASVVCSVPICGGCDARLCAQCVYVVHSVPGHGGCAVCVWSTVCVSSGLQVGSSGSRAGQADQGCPSWGVWGGWWRVVRGRSRPPSLLAPCARLCVLCAYVVRSVPTHEGPVVCVQLVVCGLSGPRVGRVGRVCPLLGEDGVGCGIRQGHV